MIVRKAACHAPRHFIYADTDCVVFSKKVHHLDIDPRRYGAWKWESDGTKFYFIAKKVYFGDPEKPDGKPTKHAKGLRVRELEKEQFEKWIAGAPPEQTQTQRRNFLKVIAGQAMFADMERKGTDPAKSKTVSLVNGIFEPA